MIKLDRIVYYDGHNTFQFNFQVKHTERVVILGHSGAGKSTLLGLIAGFQYPREGEIWLNQKNYTTTPPDKRPVSLIFQENNLFSHLTVWQNIALGISPNLRLNQEQHHTIKEIIEHVSLHDCITRLPNQISGGQRQRTALARCLIRQKPILLLDEPISALDPSLREAMVRLIKQVCDERHLTLLMVSHNLGDIRQIATRALVIKKGKITYDGQLDFLINNLKLDNIFLEKFHS
ncbi:MAG: thiamine ABC transporter ATP-binding protein ThiQ [Candidatus Arsenophonus melophagi]|nr:thiamine ABC transporter ATP-binding protein ThiQ [Candidatus Arsenophonus melophagi]